MIYCCQLDGKCTQFILFTQDTRHRQPNESLTQCIPTRWMWWMWANVCPFKYFISFIKICQWIARTRWTTENARAAHPFWLAGAISVEDRWLYFIWYFIVKIVFNEPARLLHRPYIFFRLVLFASFCARFSLFSPIHLNCFVSLAVAVLLISLICVAISVFLFTVLSY